MVWGSGTLPKKKAPCVFDPRSISDPKIPKSEWNEIELRSFQHSTELDE